MHRLWFLEGHRSCRSRGFRLRSTPGSGYIAPSGLDFASLHRPLHPRLGICRSASCDRFAAQASPSGNLTPSAQANPSGLPIPEPISHQSMDVKY